MKKRFWQVLWTLSLSLMFVNQVFAIQPVSSPNIPPGTTFNTFSAPIFFINGQPADANQVNSNFELLRQKINEAINVFTPIGVVLPWHKTIRNANGDIVKTLSLPEGWVECNGQTLNDTNSPLHNQLIPDLNGATTTYDNQGLFVRGGSTSGTYQNDQMQSHKHDDTGHRHRYVALIRNGHNTFSGGGATMREEENTDLGYASLTNPVESSAGPVRHGSETRPKNMSMVWVMRVR